MLAPTTCYEILKLTMLRRRKKMNLNENFILYIERDRNVVLCHIRQLTDFCKGQDLVLLLRFRSGLVMWTCVPPNYN